MVLTWIDRMVELMVVTKVQRLVVRIVELKEVMMVDWRDNYSVEVKVD